MQKFALGIAALALALPATAEEPDPSPNDIVAQAQPGDWVQIAPKDLMVMTLAPPDQGPGQASADGNPREVVIQLMPAPFSQGWVDNVRLLARSGYYDGLSVIRVQDNYVTQWGDPAEDEANAKPLPDGLKVMEEDEYESRTETLLDSIVDQYAIDPYASRVWIRGGWPLSGDSKGRWPVHCYGMVGVARGMSPNTGDGSSLYTVIGHAPRHLDRNIALVGRVIEGMEHLSSLPRGKGPLGFYAKDEQDKRTPILSVKLGSETGEFPPPIFQYLSTESTTFAKYAEARANRRDPFFIHPAGGADICNIPVPVRRVPSE